MSCGGRKRGINGHMLLELILQLKFSHESEKILGAEVQMDNYLPVEHSKMCFALKNFAVVDLSPRRHTWLLLWSLFGWLNSRISQRWLTA